MLSADPGFVAAAEALELTLQMGTEAGAVEVVEHVYPGDPDIVTNPIGDSAGFDVCPGSLTGAGGLSTESSLYTREIIFIDPLVPDCESLLSCFFEQGDTASEVDISPYEVVHLDPQEDGLEQITAALEQAGGVGAVHIITHGSSGSLRLGDTLISTETLDHYASTLETWKRFVPEDGDLLLYGCGVARGEGGVRFVEELAGLTGLDVAASTDSTGSADLGGDWILEYTTGPIEASVLSDPASRLSRSAGGYRKHHGRRDPYRHRRRGSVHLH